MVILTLPGKSKISLRLSMELMQITRIITGLRYNDEQLRRDRADILSRQISEPILAPFADIIRQKLHVIFSLSQPLTGFPFSALIFDDKPLMGPICADGIWRLCFNQTLQRRDNVSRNVHVIT
jgi:hypothetical protein